LFSLSVISQANCLFINQATKLHPQIQKYFPFCSKNFSPFVFYLIFLLLFILLFFCTQKEFNRKNLYNRSEIAVNIFLSCGRPQGVIKGVSDSVEGVPPETAGQSSTVKASTFQDSLFYG
jgi:hypothetical protein